MSLHPGRSLTSTPRGAAARAVLAGAVLCTLASSAGAQVELRGQARPLDAEVLAVGPDGVRVKIDDGGDPAPRTIAWDRVRAVRGKWAADASAFGDLADQLWRARARLERGDRRAAERAFEDLARTRSGLPGPSGAVLAEGLIRVRLSRGATAQAVSAWLWWLQARAAATPRQISGWIGGTIRLPPLIDEHSGLVPRLPPIVSMADSPAGVRLMADQPASPPADAGSGVAAEIAAWYALAARFEADPASPVALPAARSGDDGAAMVAEIVSARAGHADERRAARAKLLRRIAVAQVAQAEETGTDSSASPGASGSAAGPTAASARWIEAWCRAGVGRSLIRESSPAEIRQGVIEMLHVPARFADATPELARLALADAAVVLAALGDAQAAATLREERLRRFGTGGGVDDEPIMDDPPPLGGDPDPDGDQEGAP